jgi:hypothetical protein
VVEQLTGMDKQAPHTHVSYAHPAAQVQAGSA